VSILWLGLEDQAGGLRRHLLPVSDLLDEGGAAQMKLGRAGFLLASRLSVWSLLLAVGACLGRCADIAAGVPPAQLGDLRAARPAVRRRRAVSATGADRPVARPGALRRRAASQPPARATAFGKDCRRASCPSRSRLGRTDRALADTGSAGGRWSAAGRPGSARTSLAAGASRWRGSRNGGRPLAPATIRGSGHRRAAGLSGGRRRLSTHSSPASTITIPRPPGCLRLRSD
jgi:hypothetical protein